MLNEKQNNRIEISLPNGMKLVAEQNQDPNYDKEIYSLIYLVLQSQVI